MKEEWRKKKFQNGLQFLNALWKFSFFILGAPIGANPKSISFWKPLLQKIDNRLASWKGKCLNMAGRSTLIKDTICPPIGLIFSRCQKELQIKLNSEGEASSGQIRSCTLSIGQELFFQKSMVVWDWPGWTGKMQLI